MDALIMAGDNILALFKRSHTCVLIKVLLTSFYKERGLNLYIIKRKLNLKEIISCDS
jgi:hypothetical protein